MQLARTLRYRPLPIIGQRLVIETLDDVEHVLRQLVTPWFSRDSVWSGTDIEGGLAKYGLLDRECNVDVRHLDESIGAVEALRINGFAPVEPDPDPALAAEERALVEGCLANIAEGLGPCVLKLFLNDDVPDASRFEYLRQHLGAHHALELPPNYFPRAFTVTDACITNAPRIWIAKHFYL